MTIAEAPTIVEQRTWPAASARRLQRLGLALVVPLLLFVLWQLGTAYRLFPQQVLPPPSLVWDSAVDTYNSGKLSSYAAISFYRVVVGFAIGAGAGLVLGIAMGLSRTVDDHVRPLFTAIAQVPNLGWIPLLVLLLGIGEALKLTIIAKAALIPMVLNVADGIRRVSPQLIEVAESFRFSRSQLLRYVVLPAAVPSIFTGFRYGLAKAWTALVAVELLAASEGLGYLLVWGRQMFWMDLVIFAILVVGLVGFVMDLLLTKAESRFQRWRLEPTQ